MELEIQGGIQSFRARKREKLTLDLYLDFIHSNNLSPLLTVDQLNQIISIHGFKKIHKTKKKVMMEAISTMELMDPSRSTVGNDGVSSWALITLEEVVKDLADLNWQECCISSLRTLNSICLQNAVALPPKPPKKIKACRKGKVLSIRDVDDNVTRIATTSINAAADSITGDGGQMASDCSQVQKKKRTSRSGGDGHFHATAGMFSCSPSALVFPLNRTE